ncbi:MAG: thermonuclease family protein, partial [Candidatus Omnitrophica bacterium]|nr:thermonuclease family protein [Candidatus Omnitrophota bacterium]
MKKITIISILLLSFLTIFFLGACKNVASKNKSGKYDEVKVVSVLDGDTFFLDGRQKVHLIGIDAPVMPDEKTQRELVKQGKNLMEVRRQGRVARNFLKGLINKQKVKLQFDTQAKDKDGKTLLAYAYKLYCSKCKVNLEPEAMDIYKIEGDKVYLFINAFVVQWGYALPESV